MKFPVATFVIIASWLTACFSYPPMSRELLATTEQSSMCVLPPEIGPCKGKIPRWYYNIQSRVCEPFIYGGCSGNENSFWTQQECEQQCSHPPQNGKVAIQSGPSPSWCELPKATGPCLAYIPRWYFNIQSRVCETFVYGGCLGNENSFRTRQECEQQCSSLVQIAQYYGPQDPQDCFLPPNPGPCLAYIPSFYFDPVLGSCEEFIYGGCRGNGNKFQTREECERTCRQ